MAYKSILDKLLKDSTYFTILWAILVVLKINPMISQFVSPLFYFLIIYGTAIIMYDIFNEKKAFRNKYVTIIFIFLFLLGLSTIVNYKNGFVGNIKKLVTTIIQFMVIGRISLKTSKEKIKSQMRMVDIVIILGITLASIISIYMFLKGINGSYIVNKSSVNLDGDLYFYGTSHGNRMVGIFSNPNSVGAFCAIAILCAIINVKFFPNKPKVTVLYCLGIIINLVSVALSNSRGALLALLCSIFTIIFLKLLIIFHKDQNIFIRLIKSFFSTVILVTLIYGVVNITGKYVRKAPYFFNKDREEIVLDTNRENISSEADITKNSSGRVLIWKIGLNTAKKNLLFGVGEENLYERLLENVKDGNKPAGLMAGLHNVYLETLVAYGVPALISLILIIAKVLIDCIRKMKEMLYRNKCLYSYIVYILGMLIFFITNNMFESIMLYRSNLATFMFIFYLGKIMYLVQYEENGATNNIIYKNVERVLKLIKPEKAK